MNYENIFKSSIDNLLSQLLISANELHLYISLENKEKTFENMVLVEKIIQILDELLPNLNSINRYSTLARHLHFVRYYYERDNFNSMLGNSEDIVKRDLPTFTKEIRSILTENKLGSLDEIILDIVSKLRRFIHHEPSSEKDVQDMVENLFVAKDLKYERETVTIPYSTKYFRPDFVLVNMM